MVKFIKQIFISTIMLFNDLISVNSLECISMKNQECKVRPEIADVSSNDPIFFLVLRQISVVVIVIILVILMQEFVILILQKI